MSKVIGVILCSFTTAMVFGQVSSIQLNSTLSTAPLNWPDGDWYVRVILFDDMGNEVAPITAQTMFSLSSEWPSIEVTMTATAPAGYSLRFYRSQTPFNVGDMGVESVLIACPGLVCDATAPSNVALSNTVTGGWTPATVVPVTLQSFQIE